MKKYLWLIFLSGIAFCNINPKNFTHKINVLVSFPFTYSVVEADDSFLVTLSTSSSRIIEEKTGCLKNNLQEQQLVTVFTKKKLLC